MTTLICIGRIALPVVQKRMYYLISYVNIPRNVTPLLGRRGEKCSDSIWGKVVYGHISLGRGCQIRLGVESGQIGGSCIDVLVRGWRNLGDCGDEINWANRDSWCRAK